MKTEIMNEIIVLVESGDYDQIACIEKAFLNFEDAKTYMEKNYPDYKLTIKQDDYLNWQHGVCNDMSYEAYKEEVWRNE